MALQIVHSSFEDIAAVIMHAGPWTKHIAIEKSVELIKFVHPLSESMR